MRQKIVYKVLLGGLLLALPLLSGCMPHTVGSTEVGVRVKKLSLFGKKGVDKHPYRPGTYFFLPVINDWFTLDTTLKSLEMTFDVGSGDVRAKDDLVFKTIDGNDISLDVIITYHIDGTKGAHIIEYVGMSDREIKGYILRTMARSKPRDIFGELTTEQFYDPVQRAKKATEAEKVLNELLGPYGIIVESVKTKDYRFNSAYEQAIKDKKVADQNTQKYISETRAAKEEYKKKLEDASGDVKEMVAKVDGKFQEIVIEADSYYESKKRMAKAIEVEGITEAKAITKVNESLIGKGGLAMVKLEMAKALKGKKIVMLPFSQGGFDIKSTDINALLTTYGVQTVSKKKQ